MTLVLHGPAGPAGLGRRAPRSCRPSSGRFDDIGEDGLECLREIVEALEPSIYDTEVSPPRSAARCT